MTLELQFRQGAAAQWDAHCEHQCFPGRGTQSGGGACECFFPVPQDCHVLVDDCCLHDRLLRWDARSLFGGALDLDDDGGLVEPRGL